MYNTMEKKAAFMTDMNLRPAAAADAEPDGDGTSGGKERGERADKRKNGGRKDVQDGPRILKRANAELEVHAEHTVRLAKRGPGAEGVVFSLTSKGDGFYDVFYTLDVDIGTPPRVFPLLVDTGSSDLWVASQTCQCTSLFYQPSLSSTSTFLPSTLTAQYLLGSLSGPLYTETFTIGPYSIPAQALCGAERVENENMGLGFSGIVGLGLGGMSLIQELLRNNDRGGWGGDGGASGRGAPVVDNLFDPTVLVDGEENVPLQRWFSLVLDRPGFDAGEVANSTAITTTSPTPWNHVWSARLGIGTHIEEVAQAFSLANPSTPSTNTTTALESALEYLPLVASLNQEFTHWKTRLSGITIYLPSSGGGDNNNTTVGDPTDVRLSRGVDGGAFPVAVLDSGGANVLASRAVADAVYGAWGIGMGADGICEFFLVNHTSCFVDVLTLFASNSPFLYITRYARFPDYVPCTLVMNITITLATAPPIPIHPLDMSTYFHNDPTSNTCLGTIQVSDQLGNPGGPADIALGISFLRNVYTVHHLETSVGTGTYAADPTTPTPRLAIAPLTNPTLALSEFHNVRILNLSPSGQGGAPPPITGSSSESLGALSKVALGVGLFVLVCVVIFAGRWFALKRRFKERRRLGLASHTTSEMGHGGAGGGWGMADGVAEWAEVIRRKTTLRMKRKGKGRDKAALGGGWREVSEVAYDEGLVGHAATRSAAGHGSIRIQEPGYNGRRLAKEALNHPAPISESTAMQDLGRNSTDRRSTEELRQGSGPFAGFSLWTFVGAKRLLGPRSGGGTKENGGRYELTPNPGIKGHDVYPEMEGGVTEDQLRQQRFAAYKWKAKKEKEVSVWSDHTWVERGDGTLVPASTITGGGKHDTLRFNEFGERKTYGYAMTPNETIIGGTGNLVGGQGKDYEFPKDTGNDDGDSIERRSTLHGSLELGKAGKAGFGTHSRSRSASKEALPLLGAVSAGIGMASTSPLGPVGAQGPHLGAHGMEHRPIPLEFGYPTRLDSSGIITSSPYPMTGTPGENGMPPFGPFGTPPRMLPGTPPSGTPHRLTATPPPTTSTPPAQFGAEGFNPFNIPTTIVAPPPSQPLLVHPARQRTTLAAEPSLSPLTEVNSSEFPQSISNWMSIMGAVVPTVNNLNEGTGNIPDRSSLDRQSSIGALSMDSEVLVPLPISLMNLPRSAYSPPPMEEPPLPTERKWGDPLPNPQRAVDSTRPPTSTVPPPPPLPPKVDPSRTLTVQKAPTMAHPLATSFTLPSQPSSTPFYLPILPAAAPPIKQASSAPPASNMPRNNPFDMLALNEFVLVSGQKDSRFPSRETLSLGSKDSRSLTFTPASSLNPLTRPFISLNTRSSSAESVRPSSVIVPDETARPRLRPKGSEMEKPRSQSEAIRFGAESPGGLMGGNNGAEQPWTRPRSQSGGASTLRTMNWPVGSTPPVDSPAMLVSPSPAHDFAPSYEYHPTRPEQRTLPMGSTREETRLALLSRVSELASFSMGMRNRGPRSMVGGPRSSKSTGSPSTAGSPHSPLNSSPSAANHSSSFSSRQGTNYDSPLSSASVPPASSTAFSIPSSSLPRGARAPTDPRLHSHHRLPSTPRIPDESTIFANAAPPKFTTPITTPPAIQPGIGPILIPSRHGMHEQRPLTMRQPTTASMSEDPEAAYGGMAGDEASRGGWREDAAKTVGIAGVGARSRFTGPMDPYSSPFDDRSR